jgi:hypothetical protein
MWEGYDGMVLHVVFTCSQQEMGLSLSISCSLGMLICNTRKKVPIIMADTLYGIAATWTESKLKLRSNLVGSTLPCPLLSTTPLNAFIYSS